jgi:release factor glutamine methyltransferase
VGPLSERDRAANRLAQAGCVAPFEEADELLQSAMGDVEVLARLVDRRVTGEPLAWITGSVLFCGASIRVDRDVYVPRWQSEPLVRLAIDLLPADGLAADLCTGSGAIAAVLRRARPAARIVASDIDPRACRCATSNGVEVYLGNLAAPLPTALRGRFDVVIAVVPYVPTDRLEFLPRDVREFEPLIALDGGPAGLWVLEQAVEAASELLHPGGSLILELGGDQDHALGDALGRSGFDAPIRHEDEDGDLRGVEARLRPPA